MKLVETIYNIQFINKEIRQMNNTNTRVGMVFNMKTNKLEEDQTLIHLPFE